MKRESPCQRSFSAVTLPVFPKLLGLPPGQAGLAEYSFHSSGEIGDLSTSRAGRWFGNNSGKHPPTLCYPHLFAFFDPATHGRESISEVSNCCRFHRETNMSHDRGDVNADANTFLAVPPVSQPFSTLYFERWLYGRLSRLGRPGEHGANCFLCVLRALRGEFFPKTNL